MSQPLIIVGAGLAGWRWLDDGDHPRSFVPAVAQTSQRMVQSKLVAP